MLGLQQSTLQQILYVYLFRVREKANVSDLRPRPRPHISDNNYYLWTKRLAWHLGPSLK